MFWWTIDPVYHSDEPIYQSAAVHSIQIKESWHARPVSPILGDHKSGMFLKIVNVRSTFAFELCIDATNFDGVFLLK